MSDTPLSRSEQERARLTPGEPARVAMKVHGRWQVVTVIPSNGRPDLNPIRQLAKQHGLTRKAAARLYAEAIAELQAEGR